MPKTLKEILQPYLVEDDFNAKHEKQTKELEETKPLHDRLTAHYKHFDQWHLRKLKKYSDESEATNNYLWQRHKRRTIGNGHERGGESSNVQKLDEATQIHKTPEAMTVYSGVQYDPRKKMNKEGIVHHPAYLSTSLRHSIAEGFAYNQKDDGATRHVLHIHLKKGTTGAYIGDHSHSPPEREFLLPRGTNLKHQGTDSYEYERNHYGKVTRVTVYNHHMEPA